MIDHVNREENGTTIFGKFSCGVSFVLSGVVSFFFCSTDLHEWFD